MSNRIILVDRDFAVHQGLVCHVTTAELTPTSLRVRCATTDGSKATGLVGASRGLVLVDSRRNEFPVTVTHVGGSGMDDVCDWVFAIDETTESQQFILRGHTAIALDLS